jgi:glycosyltransferase involved in cell wall biosynthesis
MNTNPQLPLFGNIGIIALVPDRWAPRWQARHQIAIRLARYFHVAWVDCPPSWQESLRWLKRRPPVWEPVASPAGFQVFHTGPWSPRIGRPVWVNRWLTHHRLEHARRSLQDRGCSRIVLYLWRPEYADGLDQVDHELSCYHIDDEYSFSPVEHDLDLEELKLIRRVDQVFIHSPAMMEKKGTLNPNTDFVPNGVDYVKYATPTPEPPDLQEVPHPRIGYTGNLKRMLDWRLLLELSKRHPEWSFVLVGRMLPHAEVQEVREELSQRPNIHLIGPQPGDSIPSYTQNFDVCIMPYKMDDYTKYIYPLKLHEYLATGNPVVGSPIPSLQAFEHEVLIASCLEEWSKMITRALSAQENTCERRAARQLVAAQHDWDLLVGKLARTLARRLGVGFPDVPEASPQNLHQGVSAGSR